MDRALVSVILTAAFLTLGASYISASAAFGAAATEAIERAYVQRAALEIAADVSGMASSAAITGMESSTVVSFPDEILVEADGTRITVAALANGKEANVTLELKGGLQIQPIKAVSSAFQIQGFPDGWVIISRVER